MSLIREVVVSVVTPACNAAAFLAGAVASVQAQTMRSWELIIIDDGSIDDTVALAEALAAVDARIKLIRMPTNGGPSIARNAGFAAARGKWIAVSDADDIFLPERLATMVQFGEGAVSISSSTIFGSRIRRMTRSSGQRCRSEKWSVRSTFARFI
jgi:glycosyltransferase involved in cell wall biosynthesis